MPKGFLLKLSNHTLNWEPRTYRQINYDTFAKNIDHLIYLEPDEKTDTHKKNLEKRTFDRNLSGIPQFNGDYEEIVMKKKQVQTPNLFIYFN